MTRPKAATLPPLLRRRRKRFPAIRNLLSSLFARVAKANAGHGKESVVQVLAGADVAHALGVLVVEGRLRTEVPVVALLAGVHEIRVRLARAVVGAENPGDR